MKKLLLVTTLLCFFVYFISGLFSIIPTANMYYISNSGSDAANGLTPSTAWKTLSKVNGFTFTANDQINLERGSTFYGSLIINRNTITIDAYGSGDLPVITGFSELKGWIADGTGIYKALLPRLTKNPLNLVSINNVPQQVARWPDTDTSNGGFFSCDPLTPTDTTTIVKLSSSYTPSIGDEFILRTKKWRAIKVTVTGTSGSNISYQRTAGLSEGGSNTLEAPDPSSGYFFDRKKNFLNKFGEWWLNPATKEVSVYFGGANPNTYNVQASSIDTLLNIGAHTFVNVYNIRFVGGNTYGINCVSGSSINIKYCEFNQGGCKATSVFAAQNTTISNNVTDYFLENGITAYSNSRDNITVTNNTVSHSGNIIGMGSFNHPEDYTGMATFCRNNLFCELNTIVASGVDGHFWQCQNGALIQHEIIDTFCLVLQDHGGIYSYADASSNYLNRVIYQCWISNGIGNFFGTNTSQLMASGIYNDGASMNLLEYGNVIFNIPRSGITSNEPLNITLRDNTNFNTVRSFTFTKLTQRDSININILHNIAYQFSSTSGGSLINLYQIYYIDGNLNGRTYLQSIARAGNIDSNAYDLALLPQWTIEAHVPNSTHTYDFTNWQIASGKDIHSVTCTNYTINNVLFLKNPSSSLYPYLLTGNYVDAFGVPYSGNIVLQPWSSLILFYVSAVQPGIKVKLKVGHLIN